MDDLSFLDLVDEETTPKERIIVNQYSQQILMQKYINAGYGLIMLNGKIPKAAEVSWQTRKPNESTAVNKGNYGVVLGANDLVIDVDPRNGGDKSFEKLLIDLKIALPSTYTVHTGGGGAHFYFKKAPNIRINKKIKEYKGLDFLSEGCFVVGPWSIHPDSGKPYIIFSGDLDHLTEAPIEVIELIRQQKKVIDDKPIEYAQGHVRFISYLEHAPLAIEGDSGDHVTYKVSCYGKDLGLSAEQALSCMLSHWNDRCQPPWTEDELRIKISNAYRYGIQPQGSLAPQSVFTQIEEHDLELYKPGQWKTNSKGTLINNLITNVVQHLLTMPEIKDLVKWNDFTQEIEFQRVAPWHHSGPRKIWTDSDDIALQYYLENKFNYSCQDTTIIKAVQLVAELNRYHPVKKWIESSKWDGVKRIDKWLHTYLGVREDIYSDYIGRLVLFGAIHRIYSPGCKFDYVLVLEGDTGIGKSTAIEILGGQWFSAGSIDFQNKDTIDLLRGKWILEMAEMDVMNRHEVSAAKAFITRTVDRARMAFARRTKDFPRQCIFIGTINPNGTGYLKDDTGNRRYWPVFCKPMPGQPMMNLKGLQKDVGQLWAEALQECRDNPGQLYINNSDVLRKAEQEQEIRRPVDEWSHIISAWASENKLDFVQSNKVWVEALDGVPNKFSKSEQMRLTSILKNDLKWERKTIREGSKTFCGYAVPKEHKGE